MNEGSRADRPVDDWTSCQIAVGQAAATVVRERDDVLTIGPPGPIVGERILVIARQHLAGFGEDAVVAGATMRRAVEVGVGDQPMNVITGCGPEATQSAFPLRLHLVPRTVHGGLALPYGGRDRKTAA